MGSSAFRSYAKKKIKKKLKPMKRSLGMTSLGFDFAANETLTSILQHK